MTESIPGIPKRKSPRPLSVILGLLTLASAALVYLKLNQEPSIPERSSPILSLEPSEQEPQLAFLPPPPPPPRAAEGNSKERKIKTSAPPKAASPQGDAILKAATVASAQPCAKVCTGSASDVLKAALRSRGAQARACYQNALRQNPQLSGSMKVNLQINPDGSACGASLTDDTLSDSGVRSCVLSRFKAPSYPTPEGGCVSIQIPLNFSAR